MFCRGDWYTQGNHARDAASRRRPGDDEGIGPHRQVGTFVYSSPELCLPFSNDYQSFVRRHWYFTTFSQNIQAAPEEYEKRDSGVKTTRPAIP